MERVLSRGWLKSFILIIWLLSLTHISQASTFIAPSDEDMVVGARAIIMGKVLSVESAFDQSQQRIFTYITIKVQTIIKGQISERRIILKEMGGVVGDKGLTVWGTPQFTHGEKVILYLDTWKDGSLRTYQMFLGKYTITVDKKTGQEFAVRSVPDEGSTLLPPHTHGGVSDGGITDRMELRAYLKMVRKKLKANWERSEQFYDEYYRNTPMLDRPAEYDGISREGGFETQWTYISTSHPRWFEPDSGQPVVFMVNSDSAPDPQSVNDVNAAMNAWSVVSGSALRVQNGGSTTACQEGFGMNLILFNACDGRFGAGPGCESTLALGGLSWSGTTKVINGVTFRQARGGFISFNPRASCHFSNHCNVQEVATHELGHALGLGHSTNSAATMYAYAHFDGRCAFLTQDEIDAATFIYPGSGGGPGPLTITTSSLTSGTVNQSYSQTVVASGGTPSYSWSLVAGSGTLPPGLNLNATNGAITGTATTAGTYNFTVRVTDNASATATKALSITINQSSSSPYSAQFVSQSSIPTSLNPGQTFNVTMQFMNNGTQAWTGYGLFYLASQNPGLNQVWGGNGVDLNYWGFLPISPGQSLNIELQFTAPTTPGVYNFQWQMYRNDGVTNFFGQPSTNVAIQVGSPPPSDNAAFVSQSVSASMARGQSVSVSVTMQNNGTTTWTTAAGYKLASQNPTDNTTWGLNRVNLPSSVAPGAQVTFTFNVTTPSTNGTYNFQWRMIREGTGLFGATSTNVAVSVQRFSDVPPTHPYYAYIENIAQRGITVGCTPATYCPDGVITRAEMAVFIERVLGVFTPPAATGQRFSDVTSSHWAYAFIEDFASRGITVGCTPSTYCSNGNVTREEMAVFLERAVGRPSPPFPSSQRFVDVEPSRWSYAFAESFVANNLSRGIMDVLKRDCNADGVHFCPTRPLTRAEMAAWLVIAFNL